MQHLKFFNFLNLSPSLYINKKEKYSTKFGIFIGLFAFFACFGFTIYFLYEFFKKDEGNVVFNEIVDFDHKLNMTDFPFIFKLISGRGISYSNKLINFNFQHWIITPHSNGVPIIKNILYEKCDFKKHLKNSKYKNYFTQIDFESYFCLNIEDYELIVSGSFGDIKNGYSYLNLYLNECSNSSTTISDTEILKNDSNLSSIHNNNTLINNKIYRCAEKNEIINQIGNSILYLRIAYIDFEIDHTSYLNPYKPYLKTDAIMFTYKSKSRVFYYFKNIFYNTDVGFIEKNNQLKTSFNFDKYLITYPQVTYYIPEAFGLCSILISDKGNKYNKSYPKIQTLIANIGGVIKGITLIFELLLQYISRKSLFLYFANYLIDSTDYKENFINKNRNIKKLNNLEHISKFVFNKNKEINNFQNSNFSLNNQSKDILFQYNKNFNSNNNNYNEIEREREREKSFEKEIINKNISSPNNLMTGKIYNNPIKIEIINNRKTNIFEKMANNKIRNKSPNSNIKNYKRETESVNFALTHGNQTE